MVTEDYDINKHIDDNSEENQSYVNSDGKLQSSFGQHELSEAGSIKFKQVFDSLFPYVLSNAQKYFPDIDDAKDIAQEVFIKLWKQFDSIRNEAALKKYLKQSVQWVCLNKIKGTPNRRNRESSFHDLYSVKDIGAYSQEAADIRAEKLRRLYEEIEKLPRQCRMVFKIAVLENKKNAEVATIMGIAPKTVKNQKSRAIALLKIALLSMVILILKIAES